ncbi:MAG: hypothetical protein A3F13_07800 [Gammaproteobacteria bacterium RIFCSPHIGHO2_12_FULL_40_19]|nr:MAG: hypothetical protein A3F13_07800 [Gammaproteobacteria bacterium RIFCSPHIGHO2_12_FULL_40_19]
MALLGCVLSMMPFIGKISLNLSLVLYLVNYIPQLFYNKSDHTISGLSFYFHILFLVSYFTDLIYGLGAHMPWQYVLVSSTGTLYLLIQHVQIKKIIISRLFYSSTFFLGFILLCGLSFLFFDRQNRFIFIVFGYMSQMAAWICCFPQIIKNVGSSAALSLSVLYLMVDLLCNLCDNVSAWVLSWPMPSKVGAIFSTLICGVLIFQRRRS